MNIRKLKRRLTATKKEKQIDQSNAPLANIPTNNILPIENCGIELGRTQAFTEIACMIREGNLVRAQYLLQTHLLRSPEDPNALNCLGWIASAINLPQTARFYFQKTIDLAPHWELPKINLNLVKKSGNLTNRNKNEKFLLIKAWGFGFWSDVSQILGQLLLAELTNRTPIIHWGSNSLFTDDATKN
ncbi:MAG: hypothetical protein V1782_07685, partial [Pseudomonadota bacterium]